MLLLNANIRESFKYCLEDFVCQRGTPTTFAGTFLPPSLIYRRPPILPWVKKRPNRAYNGSKGAKIDSNGLKMFWTKNTCFCQTPGYPLPPFADNVFGKNFWRIWGVPRLLFLRTESAKQYSTASLSDTIKQAGNIFIVL